MPDISNAIKSSKLKHYEHLADRFKNPKKPLKMYSKILKTIVNGTKIPLIPPLLVNYQLVTDFLVKNNCLMNTSVKKIRQETTAVLCQQI